MTSHALVRTTAKIALGDRMLAAMNALGWQQKDVARRFRVSPALISLCISGHNTPPLPVVEWMEERARAVSALPENPPWRKP